MFWRFLLKQWFTLFLFFVLWVYYPPLHYMHMYKNILVLIFMISVLHLRYQLERIKKIHPDNRKVSA